MRPLHEVTLILKINNFVILAKAGYAYKCLIKNEFPPARE